MGEIEKVEDKKGFMKQFESLRPDLFFPESWTDEDKEKAIDLVRPQKTRNSMFSSIPMNCEAERCKLRRERPSRDSKCQSTTAVHVVEVDVA